MNVTDLISYLQNEKINGWNEVFIVDSDGNRHAMYNVKIEQSDIVSVVPSGDPDVHKVLLGW